MKSKSHRLFSTKIFDKDLEKIGSTDRKKVILLMKELPLAPFFERTNIIKMKGTVASYRVRLGDLRIIVVFNKKENTIIFSRVGYRGDVYK